MEAVEPVFVKYLRENIMPAQDYERGGSRYGLFPSSSSTGVVYVVADFRYN